MDPTFRRAFVAGFVGFAVGSLYVVQLLRTGRCADLLGLGGSRSACSTEEVVGAGLLVFTLLTLSLTLLVAVAALRRGAVPRWSLGDTFLAMGSIVAMVQAATLSITGSLLGIAHGVAIFAFTMIGVRRASSQTRRDREVATVVAMVLTMSSVIWAAFQPEVMALVLPVTVFWVLGALCYLDGARAVADSRWGHPHPARSSLDP